MQAPFDLPEDFNVYHAEDTLEALKAWLRDSGLAPGALLPISAAKVMEMDGTGMQLLASLCNSGYRLRIVDASRKFVEALETTGHMHWLGEEAAA